MHTKYSDGRGTMEAMVDAAAAKGLREIAITDHGPANVFVGISSPKTLLKAKEEARVLNQKYAGKVRILVGVEADVVSCRGDIDIPSGIYTHLDLLLVGLHPNIIPRDLNAGINMVLGNRLAPLSEAVRRRVMQTNTAALVSALKRHPVHIVTHPGLGMPVNIRQVARACREKGCLFEINTGHNHLSAEELRVVLEEGAGVVVNSDAHFPGSVGELGPGWDLLVRCSADPKQVYNLGTIGKKRLRKLRQNLAE